MSGTGLPNTDLPEAPGADAGLSELQEWLARALRNRRALANDPRAATGAARHIGGNPFFSPVEQLDIYREQFWLRHTSSLVEDFPGLGGILGQDDWERLVEGYVGTVTPTGWTLAELGKGLPQYVEDEATWLEHHPLCVDMARVEWAYCELFDAEDQPNLDAEKVSAVPDDAWEHVTLELSDTLRLVAVKFPVAALRYEIKARGDEEHVALPERCPDWLALYRKDRGLFYASLDPASFHLLERLRAGTPLGRACAETAQEHPDADVGEKIGAWFQDWAARGWIVDVRLTSSQMTSPQMTSP